MRQVHPDRRELSVNPVSPDLTDLPDLSEHRALLVLREFPAHRDQPVAWDILDQRVLQDLADPLVDLECPDRLER